MGFGSHYVTSPGLCLSTGGYKEWMTEQYHISDDDDAQKLIPKCFFTLLSRM